MNNLKLSKIFSIDGINKNVKLAMSTENRPVNIAVKYIIRAE